VRLSHEARYVKLAYLLGMRSPVGIVFWVALFTGCASHPTAECTEIGCHDGLVVTVSPARAWPHGAYRFIIEADGREITCSGSLPLPECSTRAITCDGDGVVIGESGCALSPTEHAFSDIVFSTNPETVTISIERDDEIIATQTWTPVYQTVQPNGPDCPPTCTNAAVSLDLPL
jgi:hypothetical protein